MDEVKSVCGFVDFGERLCEVVRELAEKAGISAEEAAGYISKAMQEVCENVKNTADALARIFQEFEESGIFDIEPRAHRRKQERNRARLIEQLYRAEIKRAEQERAFRRVYKPP